MLKKYYLAQTRIDDLKKHRNDHYDGGNMLSGMLCYER